MADDTIEQFLARSYSLVALSRTIARLGGGAVIAELDDLVVAYTCTGPNHDADWDLFALYALPQVHGRGVGRRQWDAALGHASSTGAAGICTWVLRDNLAAGGFYAHVGATFVEEHIVTIAGQETVTMRYCAAYATQARGATSCPRLTGTGRRVRLTVAARHVNRSLASGQRPISSMVYCDWQ